MRSFAGRPGLGRQDREVASLATDASPASAASSTAAVAESPLPDGRSTATLAAPHAPAPKAAPAASPIPAPAPEADPVGTPPAAQGRFTDLDEGLDAAAAGEEMHAWMAEVFPLCRSITGEGVRLTLRSLEGIAPLKLTEVPTGARAFDWTIPKEWEIRDAWIKDPSGRKVVDFRASNLHVVGYSAPVHERLMLDELRPHLHSLPDRPDWIPYRNSFWQESWGFCLPHRLLERLPQGEYEVRIDSSLKDGSLTYAEAVVPGDGEGEVPEVLIAAHCCHPSLANDNLSGMAVAAFAARQLRALKARGKRLRYTYRFLFAPVTIGALAWLSRNEALLPRVRHGLVLSLLGDSGPFTWKRSRRGDAPVDRAAQHALGWSGAPFQVQPFSPYGYDERQFCSPGFDLPMGCLMRRPFASFPEYHTSGDNMGFVKPEALAGSLRAVLSVLDVLENDGTFLNLHPKGEPQLGRRGLFQARDGKAAPDMMALLWVLNQADGRRTLLETAEIANIGFSAAKRAADALMAHGLLREADGKESK